jgi:RNA polymerase sigma-70 factor (ECF subfamily)
MPSELSDEKLMASYLEGNVRAFQTLLERHQTRVFNFILRNLGNRELAEDTLQEVFLRVVHRADSFRHQSKFTTWLYTIARNLCIDQRRKARYRKTVALDEPLDRTGEDGATLLDRVADRKPLADTALRDSRFQRSLEEALTHLPDEQREVFLLREVKGLKFREIAVVVGIPENTVKSRMRYALETLRQHLSAFEDTF